MNKYAAKIYAALLRLYPAGFRKEYGPIKLQAFTDEYHGLAEHGSAKALFWPGLVWDELKAATKEHVRSLSPTQPSMAHPAIMNLLWETLREDQDFTGMLVFNLPKRQVIATTFSADYSAKLIQIEGSFQETEWKAIDLIGSDGEMNWMMKSLERKVLYDVRITKDVYLFGETRITEAPGAAIETALELALEIGRML